jgi:hypothetical protein
MRTTFCTKTIGEAEEVAFIDRFVTSTTTPIATGRRDSCRVGLSPTERALVFTAHAKIG